METKIIELKEAVEFAKENGYLYAVYTKNNDNYDLFLNCYDGETVDEDSNIIVETTGEGDGLQLHFNKFTTEDGQFMFILHNNFNIPKVIPVK